MTDRELKRGLAAVKAVVDDFAKDRDTYLQKLFDRWEVTTENVESAADCLLEHARVDMSEEMRRVMIAPYDMLQLMIFSRLMDSFKFEEDVRFRESAARLSSAWQKFFAAVQTRKPDLSPIVAETEVAHRAVHEMVVSMFLGQARPYLSPSWAKGVRQIEAGLKSIAEGLRA